MRSPLVPTLLVAMLVATAFAGCLGAETAGESTISRVHTMTITKATTEAAERHDDPVAALRELLSTDLVVRVTEPGDYVLEYVDATGKNQTRALTGATPAAPVVVTGADPLAPAMLKRGEETVSVRGGVATAWWHMGDMPLGFNLTDGSKASYDMRSRVRETLTLRDLAVEEQDMVVSSLRFDLDLPMEGKASWELQPATPDGTPLLLSGSMGTTSGAADVITLEVAATQGGRPGTAGVIAGVSEAKVSGSAKLWVRDGQPIASQFLGGESRVVPRSSAWADGFFADLSQEFSCAGRSKADKCAPTEFETQETKEPASEKEVFSADDYPKVEDQEDRDALALLQRIFAQDIAVGDKGIITMRGDARDFGPSGPDGPSGEVVVEFTIEAVGVEDVKVPAGSYRGLKIIEETRTRVDVRDVEGPDGQTIIRAFAMDETIARSTIWLDAVTYQPLKMTATTPFNADTILRNAFNAIEPAAWTTIGSKPIEDSQWSFTAVAESSYELTQAAGGTQLSAVVGLALGHALMGSSGSGPMSGAIAGLGASGDHDGDDAWNDYESPDASRGAYSLGLSSAGTPVEGVRAYAVTSVSGGFDWGDMMITIDGMSLAFEVGEECDVPVEGMTACRDDRPLDAWDQVIEGDMMWVVADAGQTLRAVDPYSNTVMLSLVVR